MSRQRVQGLVYTLILFAAVAVFSNVAGIESFRVGKAKLMPSSTSPAGILTADGTDPYPKPPSLKSLGIAS